MTKTSVCRYGHHTDTDIYLRHHIDKGRLELLHTISGCFRCEPHIFGFTPSKFRQKATSIVDQLASLYPYFRQCARVVVLQTIEWREEHPDSPSNLRCVRYMAYPGQQGTHLGVRLGLFDRASRVSQILISPRRSVCARQATPPHLVAHGHYGYRRGAHSNRWNRTGEKGARLAQT